MSEYTPSSYELKFLDIKFRRWKAFRSLPYTGSQVLYRVQGFRYSAPLIEITCAKLS